MENRDTALCPLAQRVLCVAIFNHAVGDWSAYCDAVPGKQHTDEAEGVTRHGDKLPQKVAEVIFEDHLDAINAQRVEADQKPLQWRV